MRWEGEKNEARPEIIDAKCKTQGLETMLEDKERRCAAHKKRCCDAKASKKKEQHQK